MKFVRIGMAAVIICSVLIGSTAKANVFEHFPDVPYDADYAEVVNTLAELGIVKGDDYGNYNPDSTITRAEFATMMCRLLGVEDEALAIMSSSFSDVPAGHWAVGYVAKAAELGLVSGYGDGRFGPADTLTYEQAVAVIIRAFEYPEELIESFGGWPYGYITIAMNAGALDNVSGTLSQPIIRISVATIIHNMLTL